MFAVKTSEESLMYQTLKKVLEKSYKSECGVIVLKAVLKIIFHTEPSRMQYFVQKFSAEEFLPSTESNLVYIEFIKNVNYAVAPDTKDIKTFNVCCKKYASLLAMDSDLSKVVHFFSLSGI